MELGAIEKRVRDIAAGAAADNGVEFVGLEVAGSKRSPVFRAFIDKPDGVTVENCADVSRAMETVLDDEDVVPTKYVLEVSSPGLERGLFKIEDYERFTGKLAKVRTSSEIGGARNFVGRIVGRADSNIVFNDRAMGEITIPFDSIERANLKVDLEEEFRRRR